MEGRVVHRFLTLFHQPLHSVPNESKDAVCQSKPLQAVLSAAGLAKDGRSSTSKNQATATCFCGRVQLAFPLSKPGLVDTFVCHCTDCRKITASMFAIKLDCARLAP